MSTQAASERIPLMTVSVRAERDVVTARQRARQLSAELGFSEQDQVRIATAVSEVARNAFRYAAGGLVDFALMSSPGRRSLLVRISDRGPGIPDVEALLGGLLQATAGSGMGLAGARRLMDGFDLASKPGEGTVVHLSKFIPPDVPLDRTGIREIARRLSESQLAPPLAEMERQNLELLDALEALRVRESDLEQRQAELRRLSLELEETNRGVLALYAELDEKAIALTQADEMKSRFLSYASHEFRTPINSILALTHLLLQRADGDLTREQERQVGFIRQSAQGLLEIVNDLLDLAKVESGKTEVRMGPLDLEALFGTLRGIMRPLAAKDTLELVFDDPPPGIRVVSDEAKVAQILRNLVANALKFTEEGEIRVACAQSERGDRLMISVRDTGIGIAPEDQERIFQEFTQVDHRLQQQFKGTGLGLPLSRRLAGLLGGSLEVQSARGAGSKFTLTLPVEKPQDEHVTRASSHAAPILVIDDDDAARYLARQLFRGTNRPIVEADNGSDGAERARFEQPAVILLDLGMQPRNGFEVLEELKSDPATADIPVVIHTSRTLRPVDFERLAGRAAAILPKGPEGRIEALEAIRRILEEPHLFGDELNQLSCRQPGRELM